MPHRLHGLAAPGRAALLPRAPLDSVPGRRKQAWRGAALGMLALLALPGLAGAQPARAPAGQPNPARPTSVAHHTLNFESGAGQLVALEAPAANVFVADPKVAEVRPGSATTLFIFGVGPGHTTVAALDESGAAIAQYDVTVRPSQFLAGQVQGAIAQVIPGSAVRVLPQPKGLLVSGQIATPADAARVLAIARSYIGEGQTVEDQLQVNAAVQVTLRVRIAEVARSTTRNLGLDWQALGSIGSFAIAGGVGSYSALTVASGSSKGFGFNGVIDALAEENLAHILAEPNLTVMSGQSASFLAGGEYPIPVGQSNGQTSITFKKYGVSLEFAPVVLADGRINLRVSPEVSQLSSVGAVTLSSGNSTFQVSALTVRRASTVVELGSGQSFAIAGLLQKGSTQADSGLPGLGDLPVLGALFRSDKFQRSESELVIVVTPYIVRPVDEPGRLRMADANFAAPTDLERIFKLRQVGQDRAAYARIPGQAGFIVQ